MMPSLCFAQASISGKVIDKADGKPIPVATVFLNNATNGTITNTDGAFTLQSVRNGQYDMVISCIGYETYYQRVSVNNANQTLPEIRLAVKTTQLKEVRISQPNPHRSQDLDVFTHEFLGSSENAAYCKVVNPDIVNLSFNKKASTLTASTDDYLEVDNKALGYKVYYQVNQFIKNYDTKLLHYEGPVRFEEMKGKPSEQKRWTKNRREIYRGSSMNFLRSVFQSDFSREGFKAFKLIRVPNIDRPSDSLIRVRIEKFSANTKEHPEWRDSIRFYRDKMRTPKYWEKLLTQPMVETDFAQKSESKQLMQLQFSDYLYVIYNPDANKQMPDVKDMHSLFRMYGTVITLSNKRALFDSNGIFTDPSDTILDGTWGFERCCRYAAG
jgi:hypothetical protein